MDTDKIRQAKQLHGELEHYQLLKAKLDDKQSRIELLLLHDAFSLRRIWLNTDYYPRLNDAIAVSTIMVKHNLMAYVDKIIDDITDQIERLANPDSFENNH